MKYKTNHEYHSKRGKFLKEFGYGIMWLFLSLLLEALYFLNKIDMNIYHFVAGIMMLLALYKFYQGFKKYQKLRMETN